MINYYRLKRASEIKKRLRKPLLKRGTRAILAIALALSWTLAGWPALPFLPKVQQVQAFTLSLYVNTADTSGTWTRVGTTPYLGAQDQPTNYVWAASNNANSDVFGFADSSDLGTINSVYLYIYAYGVAETDFDTFVNSTNTGLGPPTSWGWVNVNVSSILTTWTAINSATSYFDRPVIKNDAGVDAAYLYVDYTPSSPNTDQNAFRWRNDDGGEPAPPPPTGASWRETANTPATNVNVGADAELIRLRFAVKETNNVSFALDSRIEFSSDAASCTTGSWTAMDTSSTAWRVTDSTWFTNDAATTQQISSPDSFTAGSILDTSNPDPTAITIQNNTTEVEFAFKGIGASYSTTYRFRITDNGTVLNTYTNCGQASTEAAAGPTMEEVMRHGNWFSGGVEQGFFWAD